MKLNGKYNKLLNEADDFLKIARKEYASGKSKKDDKRIRQGAEKAWNASVQATKALAVYIDEKMPRSYNAQLHSLRKFERKDNAILNGYSLTGMFMAFSRGLHGECFYHGEYELIHLDIDFENVARYIEIVKRIACNNNY